MRRVGGVMRGVREEVVRSVGNGIKDSCRSCQIRASKVQIRISCFAMYFSPSPIPPLSYPPSHCLFVGQPTHSFGLQMNSELADRLEREWNVNARTLDTGIGICRGTKRVRWKRDGRMIDER